MAYTWPLTAAFPQGQRYGTNPGGVNPVGGHTGVDFPCPIGTPIYAPASGVIEYAREFQTSNGSDNGYWLTNGGGLAIVLNAGAAAPSFVMGHLSRVTVREGQNVNQGDIIGYTGNSGKWTTGPHLHFEALPPGFNLQSSTYGRVNPANYCTGYWNGAATPLQANQRKNNSGATVNQRKEPRVNTDITRVIEPGAIEVFRGFARGDTVTINGASSDLWFEDQHGYCSILFFDPTNVDGLPDLTPKPASDPVGPTQRVTAADGAQGRVGAYKNADEAGERFGADLILSFKGYVKADVAPYPNTTDIWFVSISGKYFWAGSFVDEGTHDLPDLTPSKATPTAPVVTPPAVVTPAYTFTVDIALVNGITVEVIPAASSNVEVGNFPAKPISAVDHHWGTPPQNIDVVIREFQKTGTFKSANYVVGDTRIVQMVKLGDRPYHAGPQGNVFVGVEIDPRGYEKDAAGNYTEVAKKIQANVRALHAALNARYGYVLTQVLHKNVPGNATSCSPFDLAVLTPVTPTVPVTPPVVVPPVVTPPTTTPPVTTPSPEVCVPGSVAEEKAVLDKFADWMVDNFIKRDK